MLSNKNKTKSYLITEVEQLEEKLSISEQDLDYYVDENNKLINQKFKLLRWLKESNYTQVLNKIKEIENEKD